MSYTFSNVRSNHRIRAVFEPIEPVVEDVKMYVKMNGVWVPLF